jgi:ACS family hexuronate transporter-like MFS transporter
LGEISPWLVVITIGIIGAAHQSWSACIYATVGDLFPKNSVATIIGIGGMAGGFGSMLINTVSGALLTYAESHGDSFTFISYNGKSAGYMIIFCVCAVAYMIGWGIIKTLVPNFRPVVIGES